MEKKNDLLDLVIKAHGGIERWKKFKQAKLHIATGDTSGQ